MTDLSRNELEKETTLAIVVQQPSTQAIVSPIIANVNITFTYTNESFLGESTHDDKNQSGSEPLNSRDYYYERESRTTNK